MPTLAVLKARIATELRRTDLTTDIAAAIQSAIEDHEEERFWFNVSRAIDFNTVATQVAYAAAANALIPYLVKIDRLYMTAPVYDLTQYDPDDFEFVAGATTPASGRPTAYTYTEGTIRLWPTPNAVYTIRVHAHYKLTTLANDAATNAWTTEAEELIRCGAKKRLYTHTIRESEYAIAQSTMEQDKLAQLRRETSSRVSTSRLRPTEF